MNNLTRIYTKPKLEIIIGFVYGLDEEKIVKVKVGGVYKFVYSKSTNSAETKEVIGKVLKITESESSKDNPLYNGYIYKILVDYSDDFVCNQTEISTLNIKDIEEYEYNEEDNTISKSENLEITEQDDAVTLTITKGSDKKSVKINKGLSKNDVDVLISDALKNQNMQVDKDTIKEYVNNYIEEHPIVGIPGADGEKGEKGDPGEKGADGTNGKDGVSPTITVKKEGKATTVTITDTNGTRSIEINDGVDAEVIDPLAGKKILCLGDSMMFGDGWEGGYTNCIKENHPTCTIINAAVSGATLIQNDTGNYISKQFSAYYNEGAGEAPDLIIFDGGGNDCLYRATIGTGKLDSCYINGYQTTMCDALEYLIYIIKTYYPTTKLLYVSNPLMMQWEDTTAIPSVPTPDVQLEYLVAREKVLEKWGIPKADIRREGNITSCISSMTTYFADSIHLSEAGYRYVSPIIEAAIKKIM